MEQPSGGNYIMPSRKKTYAYRLPCVFPRFIRAAPTWLKIIMMLCMCVVVFGLCFYLTATLLQADNDDGNSSSDYVPASQVIQEQDGDILGWKDSLTQSQSSQLATAETATDPP